MDIQLLSAPRVLLTRPDPLKMKIRLNVPPTVREYFRDLDFWENEGGMANPVAGPSVESPIRPGDTFRVVRGEIIWEGGAFHYLAEIEKVSPEAGDSSSGDH